MVEIIIFKRSFLSFLEHSIIINDHTHEHTFTPIQWRSQAPVTGAFVRGVAARLFIDVRYSAATHCIAELSPGRGAALATQLLL